jgi:hypothetical protein
VSFPSVNKRIADLSEQRGKPVHSSLAGLKARRGEVDGSSVNRCFTVPPHLKQPKRFDFLGNPHFSGRLASGVFENRDGRGF